MGAKSDDLMKLRPVTFRYKDDPAGTLQYGLVAEEVEKLYPELVTHAIDGQAQSVRYSMLTGMLLNELQKQTNKLDQQSESEPAAGRADPTSVRASDRRESQPQTSDRSATKHLCRAFSCLGAGDG